jgi:glycosyltransferase involved in cell wall biosynthesis
MHLSVITAIHNALPVNQLYWDWLSKNTLVPFELVLVDNHSTDGSEIFFRQLSEQKSSRYTVRYVRSDVNQSYPASQNQGIRFASGEILCFINNDVWMPAGWHAPFEKALTENKFFVLSPSGQEAQSSQRRSDALKIRWRRINFISKVWKNILNKSELERLWKSLEWMYGSLESFHSPTETAGKEYMEGIKGDVVIFHRALLDKVPGIWDERVQAADWHLYLTIAKIHEENPSIPLPRILLNAYAHHFGRYSARLKFEPIAGSDKLLSIEDLWDKATIERLWWGFSLPN